MLSTSKKKKDLPENQKNVNPKTKLSKAIRNKIQAEVVRTCAEKAKLPKNASLPQKEQLTKHEKVPAYLTGRANGLRWVLQNL